MNKYVFMRGYLFNKIGNKKENFINELINNKEALVSVNNNGDINKTKENSYDFSYIQEFLNKIYFLFKGDNNYLQKVNNSTFVLLLPIILKLDNNGAVNLQIYLRVYENNSLIITIEAETKETIWTLLENKIIDIQVANTYIEKEFYFTNILSIFDLFTTFLSKYISLSEPISRNFFIIDKKSMSLKNIKKFLCQTSNEFKDYELFKDFRGFKDYSHYTNELTSVIYGNNLMDAYYRLLMLDHFIIYLILFDFKIYNQIKIKSTSLKKLYQLKEDYEYSFITKKYAKLVEDNDYICYILDTQNKYELSSLCSFSIDRKMAFKNNRFQYIFTIIGLLLAFIPLIDLILRYCHDEVIFLLKYLIKLILCILGIY